MNSSHYQVVISSSLLPPFRLSSKVKRLLDDFTVDLTTEIDTFLELSLVVRLLALGFDVLLNGVDLRLVHDQLLLDVVELVVDIVSQDLILGGVMVHRMIS